MKRLEDWTLKEIKQECSKEERCSTSCPFGYIDENWEISCKIDDMLQYDESPNFWEIGE